MKWHKGVDLSSYAAPGADARTCERLAQGLFWSDSASIELTAVCNLRCVVCPQGQTNGYHGSSRAGQAMPVAQVCGWQEQLAELGVRWLSYNIFNEPFLHPHLRAICEHGRRVGITPVISTNIARLESWIYEYEPIIIGTLYLGGSKQAAHPSYLHAAEERLPALQQWVASREGKETHPYLASEVRTLYGTREGLEWGLLRPWAGAYLSEAVEATLASFTSEQFLEWPDWFVRPNEMLGYGCSLNGLLEIVIGSDGRLQICCADAVGKTHYAHADEDASLAETVHRHGFTTWKHLRGPRMTTACSLCLKADLQYTCQLQAHIDRLRLEPTP